MRSIAERMVCNRFACNRPRSASEHRLRRSLALAAAAATLSGGPVASQEPVADREIATRLRIESPANASPTWREERLEWRRRYAPREIIIARAANVQRFGREDTAYLVAGSRGIDAHTTAYAELEGSERHSFLPRNGLFVLARRELAEGWGAIGGVRHRRYSTSNVESLNLAVDRYFGAYRAAFTVTRSHSDTAGNGGTGRAQLTYFYGRGSSVQVLLSDGTEVEKVQPSGRVATLPVSTFQLSGRHWVSGDWGIDYALGRARDGSVRRVVVSAGIRYRF